MSEQDKPHDTYAEHEGGRPLPGATPSRPYHRRVPHVTQSPINDVEPEYATINRYATLDQQRTAYAEQRAERGRRHMGTATSDADYLPLTDFQKQQDRAAAIAARGQGKEPNSSSPALASDETGAAPRSLHASRYLQTPKSGRSIFVSRQARQQKRLKALLLLFVVLALVLALVWFFILR